jgi:hypothetical protein
MWADVQRVLEKRLQFWLLSLSIRAIEMKATVAQWRSGAVAQWRSGAVAQKFWHLLSAR